MPFEDLREKLLRAGVAPRHVRRYLTELNEHLADLIQVQHGTGHTGEEAVLRARAALGTDDDLAGAMINRRGVKSGARGCRGWCLPSSIPYRGAAHLSCDCRYRTRESTWLYGPRKPMAGMVSHFYGHCNACEQFAACTCRRTVICVPVLAPAAAPEMAFAGGGHPSFSFSALGYASLALRHPGSGL